MAHFVYFSGHTDPIPDGHVPDSVEYTLLWAQNYKAINGDDGGTWAPGAFITVGGSGFNLTGTGHTVAASARLSVASTGEIKLLSGGLFNAASGSTVTQAGDWNLTSTGVATCASGSNFIGSAGSFAQWSGGFTFAGVVTYTGASVVTLNSGAVVNFNSGSSLQLKGTVDLTSTGVFTAKSGSNVVGNSGAYCLWSGGLDLAGVTTFVAGTWPQMSSRSWTSSKIYLIPLTLFISGDNRHPLIEWEPADTFGAPIPVTLPNSNADTSVIRFDEMPYGASLASIAVKTRGLAGGGGSFTLPSYKIVSWSDAEGVGFTDLSANTADAHTSGNWTSAYVTTTITVSAPVTVTRGVNYGLLVTHPYDSDLLGASVGFFSCVASGTTDELRN